QAGADERDDGQRDLAGHEPVAQPEQPVRPAGGARLFLQLDGEIRPRRPSDRRTAISFCRTAARASSRFATFAHAIRSTSATSVLSRPLATTMLLRKPGLIVACAS